MKDVHHLLTQARRLISSMDPKPGSALDAVDELVHAALLRVESEAAVRPLIVQLAMAVANAEQLLSDEYKDSGVEG